MQNKMNKKHYAHFGRPSELSHKLAKHFDGEFKSPLTPHKYYRFNHNKLAADSPMGNLASYYKGVKHASPK